MADRLNNSLSQVISPSLSSESATNTLRLSHLREEAVSTGTLTIERPPWMRLKSATQQTWDDFTTISLGSAKQVLPLFLFSGHNQEWRNPGEMLSSLQASGNRCRKVKEIEIWRVCRILKWKGKEVFPNRGIFTTSLTGKLIMLSKENAHLRQDYLKRSLN